MAPLRRRRDFNNALLEHAAREPGLLGLAQSRNADVFFAVEENDLFRERARKGARERRIGACDVAARLFYVNGFVVFGVVRAVGVAVVVAAAHQEAALDVERLARVERTFNGSSFLREARRQFAFGFLPFGEKVPKKRDRFR